MPLASEDNVNAAGEDFREVLGWGVARRSNRSREKISLGGWLVKN